MSWSHSAPFHYLCPRSIPTPYHLAIGLVVAVIPNYQSSLRDIGGIGIGVPTPRASHLVNQIINLVGEGEEDAEDWLSPSLFPLPLVNHNVGVMLGVVGMNLGGHYCTLLAGKDS